MGSMLKNALKDVFSIEEIEKVYSSFDVIGDIIIIKIPEELDGKKEIIAKILINKIKISKNCLSTNLFSTRRVSNKKTMFFNRR